jgi:hypothetical protein
MAIIIMVIIVIATITEILLPITVTIAEEAFLLPAM